MTGLVVHGPAYSAYTRAVRLVLEEKQLAYELREVDFISDGIPAGHAHPFRKVPVLEHGETAVFEAPAIYLFIESTFADRPLLADTAAEKARVFEIVSCLDHYIWPSIRELTTQRLFAPLAKGWPDDQVIARMEKRLANEFAAFTGEFAAGNWLAGDDLSLADCHAAAMIDYLAKTLEGQGLIAASPRLKAWWERMSERGSLAATAFELEAYPFAADA